MYGRSFINRKNIFRNIGQYWPIAEAKRHAPLRKIIYHFISLIFPMTAFAFISDSITCLFFILIFNTLHYYFKIAKTVKVKKRSLLKRFPGSVHIAARSVIVYF